MVLGATSAFAGDSDALKAVLKAKTYADAKALVEQNLGSMANDAEKAKAYNHLVELSMKQFNDQQSIIQMNQITKKNDPVDMEAMNEGAYNALVAAQECYKYDQLPNAKGKIAPKYDNNAERVWNARIQLVSAGDDARTKNNTTLALKYWNAWFNSESSPLFNKIPAEKKAEPYKEQVAFLGAWLSKENKDMAQALKYCDVAMNSDEYKKQALNIKLEVLKGDLKTHEDSLKYINNLKDLYANDAKNEILLDNLNSMFASMRMDKEQLELLDNALAADPNNFVALADKGMYYIAKNDADNAIKNLKKALEIKPENGAVMVYLGACLNVKASNLQDPNGRKVVYQEAIKYLDKAKELDPEKKQYNWGYNRYQAYYGLYGPNDPKTKQAEADSQN
jgi:tetratricopeptide repeat protein